MVRSRSVGKRFSPFATVLLAALLVFCAAFPAPGEWRPQSLSYSIALPSKERQGGPGSGTIHNMTISLCYELGAAYPMTEEEREPYEEVIRHFADGVYEQTEGIHRIGRVEVYLYGRISQRADVVWTREGWPGSDRSGRPGNREMFPGFHVPGHIYFHDVLAFPEPMNVLEQTRVGGYLLAQAWSHYAYGLFDEGLALSPPEEHRRDFFRMDRAPDFSLLAGPWKALEQNDTRGLNLSLRADYRARRMSPQFRTFLASAWDVLGRSPNRDPRTLLLANHVTRPHYPDLGTPTNTVVNLPGAARDDLEIVWIEEGEEGDVELVLVLDRSGSMMGDRIEAVKNASKILIDIAPESAIIGVVSFDHAARVEVPLTYLGDPGARDILKQGIDGISIGGATGIGEGAALALEMLQESDHRPDIRAIFLLSDGGNNSGVHPYDVIPLYQAEGVPIIAFAYGAGADVVLLGKMAEDTGGELHISPESEEEITRAFLTAGGQVFSDGLMIDRRTVVADPVDEDIIHFVSDSTIKEIQIRYAAEEPIENVPFELIGPDSRRLGYLNCDNPSTNTCSLVLKDPTPGEWMLVYRSLFDRTPVNVSLRARPHRVATYQVRLEAASGHEVFTVGERTILHARVERHGRIRGAQLYSCLTTPSGDVEEIVFRDDGVHPDHAAGDGVYAAHFEPHESGAHRLEVVAQNPDESASFTRRGTARLRDHRGELPNVTDAGSPGENFQRYVSTMLTVAPVDDGTAKQGSGIPTRPLDADNTDVRGYLRHSAHRIRYRIDALPGVLRPNFARVWGMDQPLDARLRLISHDETTVLKTVSEREQAPGPRPNYLWMQLPGDEAFPLYLEVSSETGQSGRFHISAGEGLDEEVGPDLVFMDFHDDHEGWDFVSPAVFVESTGVYTNGALEIRPRDNRGTFSFWESKLLSTGMNLDEQHTPLGGDSGSEFLFRATYLMSSDVEDVRRVPTIRVRSSSFTFSQSDLLISESVGDGAFSPGIAGRAYEHYFTLPAAEKLLRADFDFLNFVAENDPLGTVRLKAAALEPLSRQLLRDQRHETSWDFSTGDSHGWTPRTAQPLIEPVFFQEFDGLEIVGQPITPFEVCFGFWGSPEDDIRVELESGRLYRARFTVSSRAITSNVHQLSAFRGRLNTTSLRGGAYVNLESIGIISRLPTLDTPQQYDVYLYADPVLAGDGLLFSLDYLLVGQMFNNPDLGVVLRRVDVDSFRLLGD